jgi:hypothetical protein
MPEPVPWVDARVTMDRIGVGTPRREGRVRQPAAGGHFITPVRDIDELASVADGFGGNGLGCGVDRR